MSLPCVSIIIPTYNSGDRLVDSVDSALSQSFRDTEVIIVDDGSTDNTASLCRQIRDPRVRYFHQANGGESSARNLGMTKTRGEYVAFLDADDTWPPDFLDTMVNALRSNPDHGLAYSAVTAIHEDGPAMAFASPNRYKSGWLTAKYFEGGSCIMPSATLMRRGILADSYFDESLSIGQDNDFYMRLSIKSPFLFVPQTSILKAVSPDVPEKYKRPESMCDGILSMERFVYRMSALQFVSLRTAKRVISHKCRRTSKRARLYGYRSMATLLLAAAIRYHPLDIRLYIDMAKVLLMSRKKDKAVSWTMPEPLPLCRGDRLVADGRESSQIEKSPPLRAPKSVTDRNDFFGRF